MLVIKPIQEKEYQKEVCDACGFKYKELSFAYSEKENDKLIAACQFDIGNKVAIISDFGMADGIPEDLEALIILGRAVLSFTELMGCEEAVFEGAGSNGIRYAKALGFKEADGVLRITLKGLFDSKCSHGCK